MNKRTDASRARPARRPRPADVFGDVLPEATRDELEPGPLGHDGQTADAWYREQRPPHHDRV